MKYTLLELTQNVLSSMDSDEVFSINDTVESQQVVKILKTVYDDIITRGDPMTHKTLFNLIASGDSTKPVLMTKPDSIDKVTWIQYNNILSGATDPVWDDIKYLPLDEFIQRSHQLNPSDSNVDTMTLSSNGFTFTFNFLNYPGPTHWTTFDDTSIIFDGFNNTVDTTLTGIKTLCFGSLANLWTESDSFVPNLQPQQFALLLNEAKSLAWVELKQTPHAKAESTARKNWSHFQKNRQQTPDGTKSNHPFDQLPNFGRVGGNIQFKVISRG